MPAGKHYNSPVHQSVSDNLHIILLIRPEKKPLSIPFSKSTSWIGLVHTLYRLYIRHNIRKPHPTISQAFECIRAFLSDSGAQILPEFWVDLLRPGMSIEVEFLPPFLSPPWESAKFGYGGVFAEDEDVIMTPSLIGDTKGLLEYGNRIEDVTNKGLLTPGSPSARSSVSTQYLAPVEAKLSVAPCTPSSSFEAGKVGPWAQQMSMESSLWGDSTAATTVSSGFFRPGYSFRESITSPPLLGEDISPSTSHMPSLVSSPMHASTLRSGAAASKFSNVTSNSTLANSQTPPPSPFVGATKGAVPNDYFNQGSPGTGGGSGQKRKRTWSDGSGHSERSTTSPRPVSNGRMTTRQSSAASSNSVEEPLQSPKRPRISPNSKSTNNSHRRQQSMDKNTKKDKESARSQSQNNTVQQPQPQQPQPEPEPHPKLKTPTPPHTGVVVKRALLLDSLSAGEYIKIVTACDGTMIALREDEDYAALMERRKSESRIQADLAKDNELQAIMDSSKKRKRSPEDDVNDLIRIWSGGGAEKKRKAVVFDKLQPDHKMLLLKFVREQFIIRIDHLTAPVIDKWIAENLPDCENEQVMGYIVDVANTVYNTEVKRKSAYRSFLELHGCS